MNIILKQSKATTKDRGEVARIVNQAVPRKPISKCLTLKLRSSNINNTIRCSLTPLSMNCKPNHCWKMNWASWVLFSTAQTTTRTTRSKTQLSRMICLGNWFTISSTIKLSWISLCENSSNFIWLKMKRICKIIKICWTRWQLCSFLATEWSFLSKRYSRYGFKRPKPRCNRKGTPKKITGPQGLYLLSWLIQN